MGTLMRLAIGFADALAKALASSSFVSWLCKFMLIKARRIIHRELDQIFLFTNKLFSAFVFRFY